MLAVMESATELIALGTGENNVFTMREAELQAISQGELILEQSLGLIEALTETAGEIVTVTREHGSEAATAATRSMGASWLTLLGSGIGIIAVMIVVWLYSQRSLGTRLSALSRGMLAIAGGNLKAETPPVGKDEIGRMAEALAIFRDTAVEIEEKNLHDVAEARQRLLDAIESASDGFAFYDAADRLVLCNTQYRTLLYPGEDVQLEPGTSFEEIIRRAAKMGLIGDGHDVDATVRARVERHRDPGGPFLQQRADGRWIQISERKTEGGGTVAVYTDLTELKRREEELGAAKDEAEQALQELKLAQRTLVQSEKMASLGQLTAGIAHEIKNPLNFINNFAKSSNELVDELAAEIKPVVGKLDESAQDNVDELLATIKEDLGTIRDHGERADSIVKGMLLHSRGGSNAPQTTDLNALISESVNLAYQRAHQRERQPRLSRAAGEYPGIQRSTGGGTRSRRRRSPARRPGNNAGAGQSAGQRLLRRSRASAGGRKGLQPDRLGDLPGARRRPRRDPAPRQRHGHAGRYRREPVHTLFHHQTRW
jgi:methyl-accepting chemotaxis protein